MSDAPVLSIVIPAFGEADHLESSLEIIHSHAESLAVPYEIIVVDDGSPDPTWTVLKRLRHRMPQLRGLRLARNFGKEAAILAGLESARGQAAILMDADLQHPPELIPEMFKLWRKDGYKVVNGVKRSRGRESPFMALGARFFYRAFERLANTRLADSSDFKLLDREVIDIYRGLPEHNIFFRGLISWTGLPQAEIPFQTEARAAGRSKWPLLKRLYLAVNAIVSFSTVPLRFVTASGGLFLIFAVILAGQTLYRYLTGEAVEGFATVILLVLVVSSVLMLSLGIIGEYLAKIYEEVKRRPRYLISDSLGSAISDSAPLCPSDESDGPRIFLRSPNTRSEILSEP